MKSCLFYGESYFVLKNDMKSRTTISYGDSCSEKMDIATFDDCLHMLYYYDDDLIKKFVDCSRYNNEKFEPYIYTELQFHGTLDIHNDVEKIMINKMHIKNHMLIDKVKQLNVPYEFI